MSRNQVRHVVQRAGLYFVRPADPPGRPDEALLFVGDDAEGIKLEVVGVELADGRLRVVHAMPMRPSYEPLYQDAEMATVKKPAHVKPPRTRAGTHLSREYEQALTAEAEAGFDPAVLTRRRAGRPSLSGRPGHSSRLGLRLDDDTYESIRRLAERQHRKISDVVREAIGRYLEAN